MFTAFTSVRDFFSFFLAVDFIRNILGKFFFWSRKQGAFTLSSLKITLV